MTPLRPLRRPPRLVPGDRVAVVAPSSPVDPDRLHRGCAVLAGWGLDVVVGRHVLDRDPDEPYLAGADAHRAGDLQWAMSDPSVAAVICARGGSGAARLVGQLDWAGLSAAPPRVFVGFSDVTVLHEAFASRLGLVTLYGPMAAAATFAGERPDDPTREHLRRTLFEPETVQVLRAEGAAGAAQGVAQGVATGVTVGGTLSVLCQGVGTPEGRPARGGIAVLEDVAEAPYRLDGMLSHLLRSGWFDGVRAVALGSWEGCATDAGEAVARRLAILDVPVLVGLGFGHGAPQVTIPLGVEATLDTDAGTVTLHRAALA